MVTGSTFRGNSARAGGAIYVRPSTSSPFANNVSNSTFVDNTTYEDENTDPNIDGGGAIYCRTFDPENAPLRLNNCTISENSVPFHGGGFFLLGNNGSPVLTLNSCILNTGASGENLYNSNGTITSQGYNVSNDTGAGFLTGSGDQINTDPMLDPAGLQNNGGPTETIALQPGSPAIDTGDPNGPARDQRYYLRTGPPDKGAFEYNGSLAAIHGVSRKVHGAAGTFDVDLPFSGDIGNNILD